jgi:hypothetical protein
MKTTKYLLAVLAAFTFSMAQAQEAAKLSVLDFFYPLPTRGDSLEYTYKYRDSYGEGHDLQITARKKGDEITWEIYKSIQDCCTGKIGSETCFYRYDKGKKSIILTKYIYERSGKSISKAKRMQSETYPNTVELVMPPVSQPFEVLDSAFSDILYEHTYKKGAQVVFQDTTYELKSKSTVYRGDTTVIYDTTIVRKLSQEFIGYHRNVMLTMQYPHFQCIRIENKPYNSPVQAAFYAKGIGLVKTFNEEWLVMPEKKPRKKSKKKK